MITSEQEQRVIIGETERAGLPISAPLVPPCCCEVPEIKLRWVKRRNSFSLQIWRLIDREAEQFGWVDVPCVEEPAHD